MTVNIKRNIVVVARNEKREEIAAEASEIKEDIVADVNAQNEKERLINIGVIKFKARRCSHETNCSEYNI